MSLEQVIEKLKRVDSTTKEERINIDINIKLCKMQIKIRDKKTK